MSNQGNYEDYPARWPEPDAESAFTAWVTVPYRDHAHMYELQARDGHRSNVYADAVAEYLVNHGDPVWFAEVWPGATAEGHGSAPTYPAYGGDDWVPTREAGDGEQTECQK